MKLCKKHNQPFEYACKQCKKKYCKICIIDKAQCQNIEHQLMLYSEYLDLRRLEKEKKLVIQIEKMKENTFGLNDHFTFIRKKQFNIDAKEQNVFNILMNQLRILFTHIKEPYIHERMKWTAVTKKIRSYQKRNENIEKKNFKTD